MASFRLIDGVVVAAVALLGLKTLGFFAENDGPGQQPAPPASFGRVLAHARTNYTPIDPVTTGSLASKAKEEAPAPAEAAPRATAPPLQPPSQTERSLFERLGERREELQQRTREMEAREKLLQEQERRLEERLGQVKTVEETQKSVATARAAGDPSALKNLVIMYESMKPKEAARVFDRLPLEVLLSVVTQMNSRKMSEVLANMTPDNAEKLTVALAQKASGAGEERRPSAPASLPAGELPAIERSAPPR